MAPSFYQGQKHVREVLEDFKGKKTYVLLSDRRFRGKFYLSIHFAFTVQKFITIQTNLGG